MPSPSPPLPSGGLQVANSDEATCSLVQAITQTHNALSHSPSLEPSAEVDALFGKLVTLCSPILEGRTVSQVLSHPQIAAIVGSLQRLCAEGEFALEVHWAARTAKLVMDEEVRQDLRQFPYYDNYVDLTRMEMHAIFSVILRQPRMIAFLGSGPLPLSSICLVEALHKHNPRCPVQIHNIDWDPIAVNLSSQLCQRLGGSCKAMRFACADIANELRDLREFDVIFLAALVGNSSAEKERIAASVSCRMRAGAIMVLRSSHSLRSLLYPVWARS